MWTLDEFDNDCNKISLCIGRIMGLFIGCSYETFGMVLTSLYNSSISLSWFSMAFDNLIIFKLFWFQQIFFIKCYI